MGFFLFLAVFLGVLAHGTARLVLGQGRPQTPAPAATHSAYVFGRYERLWHWTMALSGILLIITGFDIHAGGGGVLLPLGPRLSLCTTPLPSS